LEPKLMADRIRATARQTTNCNMSSVMGDQVLESWTNETYSVRRNFPCRSNAADP
jgi:hypothetical protein